MGTTVELREDFYAYSFLHWVKSDVLESDRDVRLAKKKEKNSDSDQDQVSDDSICGKKDTSKLEGAHGEQG